MSRSLLAVPFVLVVGCATPSSTQMTEVDSTQFHRIENKEVQQDNVTVRLANYEGGDIFPFDVKNLRGEPVLVDRDAVEMVTPSGERMKRLPGGKDSMYTVPPAGYHRVNVRFDMTSVRPGEIIKVDFAPALQVVGGAKLPLPPLAIKYF